MLAAHIVIDDVIVAHAHAKTLLKTFLHTHEHSWRYFCCTSLYGRTKLLCVLQLALAHIVVVVVASKAPDRPRVLLHIFGSYSRVSKFAWVDLCCVNMELIPRRSWSGWSNGVGLRSRVHLKSTLSLFCSLQFTICCSCAAWSLTYPFLRFLSFTPAYDNVVWL